MWLKVSGIDCSRRTGRMPLLFGKRLLHQTRPPPDPAKLAFGVLQVCGDAVCRLRLSATAQFLAGNAPSGALTLHPAPASTEASWSLSPSRMSWRRGTGVEHHVIISRSTMEASSITSSTGCNLIVVMVEFAGVRAAAQSRGAWLLWWNVPRNTCPEACAIGRPAASAADGLASSGLRLCLWALRGEYGICVHRARWIRPQRTR